MSSTNFQSGIVGMGYSLDTFPQDDKVTDGGAAYCSTNYRPSAPPLTNCSCQVNKVSIRFRADANTATETEPYIHRSTLLGAREVNTTDLSSRSPAVSPHRLPARYPTCHARQDCWYAYDACVRLCLHYSDRGSVEARDFLNNECALLREAFGLKSMLLQSGEELMRKDSPDPVCEGASVNTKKTLGVIKIQVREVRMGLQPPTRCFLSPLRSPMLKLEPNQLGLSNAKSIISSGRRSLRRDQLAPPVTANGSLLHKSLAHMIVGTQRVAKKVAHLIKISSNAWCRTSSLHEVAQESYSCSLRLKSSTEMDAVKMQPGSGETCTFLLDRLQDDLIIEVQDSMEEYCGRAVVKVPDIADESGEKLTRCFVYCERKEVGEMQLYINYSTIKDGNSHKCASGAETTAYDCVLEAVMNIQQFQKRNLLLHGSWRWLVTQFASHYGVSDAYTKLRYLSHVVDVNVATPTADCLNLVYDLLLPVVEKGQTKQVLGHQEVRVMGEVSKRIDQILTLAFENYKSLDESSRSGITDVLGPATGAAAPALAPALKIYNILHDILSPEIQSKLCKYFQNAIKRRCRRHLAETDKFVANNYTNVLMDSVAVSTAYEKMKSLCLDILNEILADIEIHKQGILPSFIDLPNISSSIYSTELCSRLRAFLVSCPPAEPTSQVVELVVATADFQLNLSLWNSSYIEGGVDAKELFHPYISKWIRDKRLDLLALCKLDTVKFSSCPNLTTPFVDDIYNRLKETLAEYDVIISRWPEEYTSMLENTIADVEMAVLESLDKQYNKVLAPLRKSKLLIKPGAKYVQKFSKRNVCPYNVSKELGVLLNSMKRMVDILRPQIDSKVKLRGSCIPETGNKVPSGSLSEVTMVIEFKFRGYLQAVIDKLVANTRLRNATKLKKIIRDAKKNLIESDLRCQMEELLSSTTINQLRGVLGTQVFVIVYRDLWNRMGQDVLKFLESRKELRSWCKASRLAVTVLNDTFASRMQELLGNEVQEKDLETPQYIQKLQLMLSIDVS